MLIEQAIPACLHGNRAIPLTVAVVALLLVGIAAVIINGAQAAPVPGGKSLLVAVDSRTAELHHLKASKGNDHWAPDCKCEASSPTWRNTSRTIAKCVFIDLGAAGGNTFEKFLSDGFYPLKNCPNGGEWEAWLVEANPYFYEQLANVQSLYAGKVHSLNPKAAYQCRDSATFNIDGARGVCNSCGSSMKRKNFISGAATQTISVRTINVVQFIAEHVIPDDYAILKMDIEGAEYDIIPCLAKSPYAHLLKTIYLEEHPFLQKRSVYTPHEYAAAINALVNKTGIRMPHYHSLE